ncbi:MAG TPA: hypothetical protein VIF82_07365 [Burkholderiaceae bacterium]|jgi:hypothetical protein
MILPFEVRVLKTPVIPASPSHKMKNKIGHTYNGQAKTVSGSSKFVGQAARQAGSGKHRNIGWRLHSRELFLATLQN